MTRNDEIGSSDSCLNRSGEDEPVFVLCARDLTAPVIVRAWCHDRIVMGKNKPDDAQITEALELASKMERWYARNKLGRAIIV